MKVLILTNLKCFHITGNQITWKGVHLLTAIILNRLNRKTLRILILGRQEMQEGFKQEIYKRCLFDGFGVPSLGGTERD